MRHKTKTERLLGAHISIAGGISRAFTRAEKATCTAMQIFTKNQSRWAAPILAPEEIERFQSERDRTGVFTFAHAAYLPNLASPDEMLLDKSLEAMKIEMQRCDALDLPYLIFHPGSYTTDTRKKGVERVARSLRELYDSGDFEVALTLEITAGQGTNLGNSFDELAEIIELSGIGERLKVCYDTCHAFAAGYDIRDKTKYAETMDKFDRIIGIERLAAIHLNDTKNELGSRKDRHEHIGKGFIGIEGFRNIMNDERFFDIPMVLETPKWLETRDGSDIMMDPVNLKKLRELIED